MSVREIGYIWIMSVVAEQTGEKMLYLDSAIRGRGVDFCRSNLSSHVNN